VKAVIDHVGVAISDLGESLKFFRDALGLELEAPEDIPSQRVRAHFLQAGDATVELVEPTSEDSAIAKFITKRGPGLHHLCLRVDDIVSALAELKAKGVRLIDETPRPGAHHSLVAFIHPSSTHGVLVELKQVASQR
jgi:methylmalonyl-CoA epimerase